MKASEGAIGAVAVFNDAIRDGLKGSVFDAKAKGWISGSASKDSANRVLFGVTGGYLIGFIFTALAVGILTKHFGRSLPVLIAAMVLGLILCYAFGSLWFLTLYTKNTGPITVGGVLGMCVLPFLPVDGIKILLAAFLTRRLERFVKLP